MPPRHGSSTTESTPPVYHREHTHREHTPYLKQREAEAQDQREKYSKEYGSTEVFHMYIWIVQQKYSKRMNFCFQSSEIFVSFIVMQGERTPQIWSKDKVYGDASKNRVVVVRVFFSRAGTTVFQAQPPPGLRTTTRPHRRALVWHRKRKFLFVDQKICLLTVFYASQPSGLKTQEKNTAVSMV